MRKHRPTLAVLGILTAIALPLVGCASTGGPAAPADLENVRMLLQADRVDDAVKAGDKLARRHPKDAAAQIVAGEAFIVASQFDDAIGVLDTAVRVEPKNGVAHIDLGIAQYHKADELGQSGGLATIVAGLFNDAGNSIQKGLSFDPKHADGHYFLGLVRYQQYRFPEAEAELKQVLALRPNDPVSLYQLGEVASADGRLADAASWYRQAITAYPDYLEAYKKLSGALVGSHDVAGAEQVLRDGIKKMPGEQALYDDLWSLYAGDQNWKELLAAYDRLAQTDPGNARVQWYRGYVLGQQGGNENAIQAYEKAVALDPTLSSALIELAKIETKEKKVDSAIDRLRKARQIERHAGIGSDESPALEAVLAVSMGLFGDGQRDQAIAVTKEFAETEKTCWYLWSNLGLFYRDSGHYPESFEAYRKAVAVHPKDGQLQNDTGLVLDYHLDRAKEAIPYYERAIAISHHNETYGNLVRRYVLWKEFDKAIQWGEEGLKYYPDYGFIQQWLAIAKEAKAGKPLEELLSAGEGGGGGSGLRGAPSIGDVARELKLEGIKKDAVESILKEFDDGLMAAYQAQQATNDMNAFRTKVEELRKTLQTELGNILTPDELKLYQEKFTRRPRQGRAGG